MNVLNNMKTSVKLTGSFLILAVITAVVGILGIYYLKQIDAADTELYEHQTVPLGQIAHVDVAFQRTRVNLRDLLLAKTPEEAQKYIDTIKELDTEITTVSSEYEKLILSAEMHTLYDAYKKDYEEFAGFRDQIISLTEAGKTIEALALMRGDAFKSAKAVEAGLDAMQKMKEDQAKGLHASVGQQ